MGTKTRFATWLRDGKILRVFPPGWPKNTELSFTDKADMIAWAQNAHVMLREIGRRYA